MTARKVRGVVGALLGAIAGPAGAQFADIYASASTQSGSTQSAAVGGVRSGNTTAFKGIPHAAEPIGDLRGVRPRLHRVGLTPAMRVRSALLVC